MNENDKDDDLDNFMEDTDKYLNPESMKDGVKFLMVINIPGLLVGWIDLFRFFMTHNASAFTFLSGLSFLFALGLSPILLTYVFFSKKKFLSDDGTKVLFLMNIASLILFFIFAFNFPL